MDLQLLFLVFTLVYLYKFRNHQPLMFIGMTQMQLNNFVLARENFELAYSICPVDPLLLNEMGSLAYHIGR